MVLEDLSFQFLRKITDDFSKERILGEGAFGIVYKGVTKDGKDVAVKMLKSCVDPANKQFRNEFHTLVKLKHENIVKVLGYCYETKKKPFSMPDGSKVFADEIHAALCLEYLHNGSLQKHLSDESCELKYDDWHMRFKLIKGICEGLKYMHKDDIEKPTYYHLDLKPDNILLDKDMVPKIADFGLSKIFGQDVTWTTKNAYGTLGYQPPEYIDERCEISGKFDIFSLGVMMIRIVSGPESYPKCLDMPSDEYIDQVRINWRKRLQATNTNDSLLGSYCHQIVACIQIALNCLENDSQKRPDIVNIIEKLNKIETDMGKIPEKGCGISFSKLIVQNNSTEMRKESKDITAQHQNPDFLSSPSCTKPEIIDARETSTDVLEELIVGRGKEKREIITSLLEGSSKKISILPIYGIGGIGKTTFSRLIYNDPKFKNYSKAWVHVSHRSFDLNEIRDSIISQLYENVSQPDGSQVIHSCLTELLHGEIMIVLDDLWEDDPFKLQDLKDMLYHADSKIIILVTTRSESVAERICTNHQPYKISPLTNGMCWDIIQKKSDFGARDDKEQLTHIGQEIAQKCAGVALAAQSLGFTLRGKSFDQWIKVKDNDIWKEYVSNDISLPNHVLASLMLSYSYMDPCLKRCFTYCAIFPKGHRIVKNDLIYQWISLGYIEPTKLLSVMDLCNKYILQLQGQSFFQLSPKVQTSEAYNDRATIFTMHDLVHDLAISILGNEILDQSKQGSTRGRSYQYALLADCSRPLELFLTSHARLIALCFLDYRGTELSGAAFAPASSLRVLDLSECSIHKLPDSIAELEELRYLSAPGVQDQMLPECITRLSLLIFLNLRSSTISALPESIGEMKNLMHLDLSGCKRIRRLPDSFMTLEKLVHLDLSDCSLMLGESESLGSLSRLEHLSLSGCYIAGDLEEILGGLRELQYLNLSSVKCSGSLCRGLEEVVVHLTKLRYLDIQQVLDYNIGPKAEHDTFLELISSLHNLQYLSLAWTYNLHSIPESIENLSKLETLDITQCSNLRKLPDSISRIHSLKYLHVSGCSSLDKSTLPQYRNSAVVLPNFVVHASDGESSSSLCQLEYENPTVLEVTRLENVKYTAEAQRIKLVEKQSIEDLQLVWTRGAERFVDDMEVLRQLVPPDSVQKFTLNGYQSVSFPSWMMNIDTYMPHLVQITMHNMPSCNNLPPFGQLPNLKALRIERMDGIRKIDKGFYGGGKAFPKLEFFRLHHMKCLEEWNTPYPSPSGEDGFNELVFSNLRLLSINDCTKLRFKSCPPPGQGMTIIGSDQVILSSWGKGNRDSGPVQITLTTKLSVVGCQAPVYQWSLLHHLPCLKELRIVDCRDLTCGSTDLPRCLPSLETLSVVNCKSIVQLLGRLGGLTSFKELYIIDCEGIKAIPGLQQLTRLQRLEINRCPELVEWCRSEENKMKLAHIKEIVLDFERFSVFSIQESDSEVETKLESPADGRSGCSSLDMSAVPEYKNGAIASPNFVFHAAEDEASSNLCQIESENPTILKMSRLEKVKSAEEAQRIKVLEKQSIENLQLEWTRDANRFVDDTEVLKQLLPPASVEKFTVQGYESVSFPPWMMDNIATYLPHLCSITLRDLPNCEKLPPLGQLPNLQTLQIGPMDSIKKIDQDLYGAGGRAFPRLESFGLQDMKCLEEWKTPCTSRSDEDGSNELLFSTLVSVSIQGCPKLRFKPCIGVPVLGKEMIIDSSDGVISSLWECRGHVNDFSSAATTCLYIKCCEAPLHQWDLLRHLPGLKELWILECTDLTCSSTDLLQCLPSLETICQRLQKHCCTAREAGRPDISQGT